MLREILIDCYNNNKRKMDCSKCQWVYYCEYINNYKFKKVLYKNE